MRYVYGCSQDKTHPRSEVVHGMTESARLFCQTCGAEMRKVPQPFMWGRRPFDVLLAGLEEKYEKNHYRRSLSK